MILSPVKGIYIQSYPQLYTLVYTNIGITIDKCRKLLEHEGTEVDVVEHELGAFIRLSDPNHGYNFVFLGSQPNYPDAAKRMLREKVKKNFFE